MPSDILLMCVQIVQRNVEMRTTCKFGRIATCVRHSNVRIFPYLARPYSNHHDAQSWQTSWRMKANRKQNKKPAAVARVGRPYRLYLDDSVRRSREQSDFPQRLQSHTLFVTLPYRTLQSALGCYTVVRRTWVTAAGSNFAFKIAAKPLQIQTWLLLTVHRNSSSLYPTVSLPTLSPLRHTTLPQYVRYRQTRDGQTTCCSLPKVRPNGRHRMLKACRSKSWLLGDLV